MKSNSFIQAIGVPDDQNVFYLSKELSEWLFASKFWENFNLENGTIFDQYEEDEIFPDIVEKISISIEKKINELLDSNENVIEFVYAWTSSGSPLVIKVNRDDLVVEMRKLNGYLIDFLGKSNSFVFSLQSIWEQSKEGYEQFTSPYEHHLGQQVLNSLDVPTQDSSRLGQDMLHVGTWAASLYLGNKLMGPGTASKKPPVVTPGKGTVPAPVPKPANPALNANAAGINGGKVKSIPANEIRFSQNTISYAKKDRVTGESYIYDALVKSMKTKGWEGEPVDVVRMPDKKLTSIDNTRINAAREAGIDVKAKIHEFNDPLPMEMIKMKRFGNAKTWGEAISQRIKDQRPKSFGNENPVGSSPPPKITRGNR